MGNATMSNSAPSSTVDRHSNNVYTSQLVIHSVTHDCMRYGNLLLASLYRHPH